MNQNENLAVLAIFRTNQLFASILLAFYILFLQGASVWILPPSGWEPAGYGPFAEWLYGWIGYDSKAADITAMVLLLLQAFYINFFVGEHRLADEVSLFPGLFYILVSSLLPEFQYLSPLLLGNTFFLIVTREVIHTYKKAESAGHIYNIGFWTAIGALFYPSFLVLFFFGFVGLNILRAFKFRERLMVLTGLATPYILLSVYYFWAGQLEAFWQNYLNGSFAFLDFVQTTPGVVYRSLGVFAVLLLMVLFSYRTYQFKQTMQVQRKINILYWGLLITALSLFIQADIQIDHLLIMALPLGIMLSFNFIKMPNRLAEAIHLIVFVATILFQFSGQLIRPLF